MSNGKNPLMLMMALAMPGAAHALGLGDLHVNSALNERLVAEIDIVGATPEELADLRAAVANRETFLQLGAERPAFLASATFKLEDKRGRPVLSVRSTDAFTEPLVNFVVDLRWHHGQLVRQYTLLLDPPGFAAEIRPGDAVRAAALAAAAAAPIVETKPQTVARQVDPPTDQVSPKSGERAVRKTTHIRVGAKATLRGVAWRVGERSDSDLQRMMIAIFRANPSAFDGNINRLYRGALLTIPSFAEVAAISPLEAKHEFHAQMAAWRGSAPMVAASGTTAPASVAPPASVAAPPAGTVASPAPTSAAAEAAAAVEPLDQRVQLLEKELGEMKGLLETEQGQMLAIQRQAEHAAAAPIPDASPTADAPQAVDVQTVAAPQTNEAPETQPRQGYAALVAGLGTLAAALAALYFRFRRRAPAPGHSGSEGKMDAASAHAAVVVAAAALAAEAPSAGPLHAGGSAEHAHGSAPTASDDHPADARPTAPEVSADATNPMLPILPASAGRSEIAAATGTQTAPQDTTVSLQVDTINLRMSSTQLDYNLVDLDLTAQHVQMPSVLNENAVVKERRTNLVDVLKLAIEREPDRHDLRMKLLELYYSAAATNRKAFLEVVQKFARDRDYLKTDQWDKIAFMGRQIAADNPLFVDESESDDDLANCA
ncbi:MAG TPA: FimV/HubP family polar landmark protein [Steroidobacteraceae bacterium]